MASGYVTSDGKDLDQRYLAIGGKAASASVADRLSSAVSVRRAGNVVYATVSLPKNMSSVNPITVRYTCPCSGVIGISMTAAADLDFTGRQNFSDPELYDKFKCFYVNKGDVLSFLTTYIKAQTVYLHITPVSG